MKVPEPRKLPSGSWFIQLRLNGQSIPITALTKKECIRMAEMAKAEHRNNRAKFEKPKDEYTLHEVIKRYIDNCAATLSPSTIRGYTQTLNNRFRPYMGTRTNAIHWQRMIDNELSLVSEKTVKNAWGLVHASLKFSGLPVPEIKLAKVPVNEIAFLQPEEITPFCNELKGKSYEIPLLLELHGLRLSEVLGLDWSNIDLKKELITVNGAKVLSNDGLVYKKTNKNKTSTRVVPIMIPQLKKCIESTASRTGPVANQNPAALLRDVQRTCKAANVTRVSNHGLRHSFASLCYHLGISERQLMQWGGWADYQTMHKIYIRLAASDESKAADSVKKFFSSSQV